MDRNGNNAPSLGAARVGSGPSQVARKAVIAASIIFSIGFLIVADSYWSDGGVMHEGIEWFGIVLIVIAILGRTWCTLFIGGRKNNTLVTIGPYSMSRNPLYFFSIVGAGGIGAQFGSFTVALVCAFFAWAVFLWTAWREEASLVGAFGDDYRRYTERVPRFVPRFALWNSPSTIEVQPRMIATTFFDAAIFLVAIPIAETFEWLHDINVLPIWFSVP